MSKPEQKYLEELSHQWPECELIRSREDISDGVNWTIHDDRHAVIVHLGGVMTELETELDGFGRSFNPANPGELWIVPARSRYASQAEGRQVEYAVFYLNPNALANLIPEHGVFETLQTAHGIKDEFCYQTTLRLLQLNGRDDDVSVMLSDQAQRALYLHFYQQYGQEKLAHTQQNKRYLSPVDCENLSAFIYENMAERIVLENLTALTDMPINTFLIAFKKAFNMTPAQYIIAQRLRRTQWLLSNSNYDITRIALEAGFSSHSHFSSTFKHQLGITPSQFRKDRAQVNTTYL